jgi:hypothetical protein
MGRVARYEGVEKEHDEKRGTHRKGSKVGREKWLDRSYGRGGGEEENAIRAIRVSQGGEY